MHELIMMGFSFLENFEFARFATAGTISAVLYAVLFVFCNGILRYDYKISVCFSFVPSFLLGFLLQKYWTFRSSGPESVRLQVSLYATKRMGFFLINFICMYYLVERKRFHPMVAQSTLGVIGIVAGYYITRWIFTF